jgi:hypothetical protein
MHCVFVVPQGWVIILSRDDANFLDKTIAIIDERDSCGWNTEYGKLPVKYSKELLQTRPNIPSKSRGSNLCSPTKMSVKSSKDEFVSARKRRRNDSGNET